MVDVKRMHFTLVDDFGGLYVPLCTNLFTQALVD